MIPASRRYREQVLTCVARKREAEIKAHEFKAPNRNAKYELRGGEARE